MPNSCKSIIKRLRHNGAITQAEFDKLMRKLDGWIPVSERLPKAGEYIGDVAKYYLVQNEYGDMMVAHYAHSEYWEQMHQLGPIADDVVAWMQLPKPYVPDTNVGEMKESEEEE